MTCHMAIFEYYDHCNIATYSIQCHIADRDIARHTAIPANPGHPPSAVSAQYGTARDIH